MSDYDQSASTNAPARFLRESIDAPFAVDQVHRVRFDRNVLDPGNRTLIECLGKTEGRPHRLIAFIDEGLHQHHPALHTQIRAYADAHPALINLAAEPITVPGGEQAKNDRKVYDRTILAIHEAGICRHSFALVIGGGAVLDAVGFAAATAHRGVRLVRMPTTTLSQGDGGIGVKNGINAFGKKNFLGSFATPWAVVNDFSYLGTLSNPDYRGGFSEAVKVGLIKDKALFESVTSNAARIAARDEDAAVPIIIRSAQLHLQHIVDGGDPYEQTRSRPLDFGHWSAHKLEQITNFDLRHGEAVAIGVALDVVYSTHAMGLPWATAERVLRCLHELGFDLFHPAMAETAELLEGLDEFREHLGGELTITLIRDIGEAVDVHEMDHDAVRTSIDQLEQWSRAAERDELGERQAG